MRLSSVLSAYFLVFAVCSDDSSVQGDGDFVIASGTGRGSDGALTKCLSRSLDSGDSALIDDCPDNTEEPLGNGTEAVRDGTASPPVDTAPEDTTPATTSTTTPEDTGPQPTIGLSKGKLGEAGYWYEVRLSGFAPSSEVVVECHNSVDQDGFYSQSLHIDKHGTARDSTLCRTLEGPDHWVTASGIESNHVSWENPTTPEDTPRTTGPDPGHGPR